MLQDNIAFQVDYLMPAAHQITLTGDEKWSAVDGDGKPTAKPRHQVKTWCQMMINALGFGPDLMICGTEAAEKMWTLVENDKAFDARRITAGEFSWKATSNYDEHRIDFKDR